MVRTNENASHHRVIRRDDNPTVQPEHEPAIAHDRSGEYHSDQSVLMSVVHPVHAIRMQFFITPAPEDVCYVAGSERWINTVELVAFGNRDSNGLGHLDIFA
jgi:hypothetical protein